MLHFLNEFVLFYQFLLCSSPFPNWHHPLPPKLSSWWLINEFIKFFIGKMSGSVTVLALHTSDLQEMLSGGKQNKTKVLFLQLPLQSRSGRQCI